MTPATYNFSVVRGTSATVRDLSPLILRFSQNGVPLQFDSARLSVYKKHGNELKGILNFRCSTDDTGIDGVLDLVDEYAAEIAWYPSAEQSRSLLVSDQNYYEVELRLLGSEVVYVLGQITGIGGLNEDEGAS